MVDNLFATPFQVQQQQQLLGRQQDLQAAALPPGRGLVALGSHIGRLLGNAPRLFGATTPAEKVAQARQTALSKAQQVAGNDPQSFLREAANQLMKIGDYQGASEMVDKFQSLMANQAKTLKDVSQVGVNQSQVGLNQAKATNEAGKFAHEDTAQERDLANARRIQSMKIAQATKELNANIAMKGIQLSHDDMNKYQDRLVAVKNADTASRRATTYQEVADARKNYWIESLSIAEDKLAEVSKNNTSLDSSRQFLKIQGEATRDYRKSLTESMAAQVLNISPKDAAKMSQSSLFNKLPASARAKITNDVNDFISRLNPIERYTKSELPAQDDISKYSTPSGAIPSPDQSSALFLDLTVPK